MTMTDDQRKADMDHLKDRCALLEDALDHIKRVAGMASRPTRRLDWISARADLALKGRKFNRDDLPQYPKNRKGK